MGFRGKKPNPMPSYENSYEEEEWLLEGMKRGIRVSPRGIFGNGDEWYLEVSTDGKTWKRSPKTYDRDTIWKQLYLTYKYYYDKRRS